MKNFNWKASLVAPATGPLLYALIIILVPYVSRKEEFTVEGWLLFLMISIAVSYIVCFILGTMLFTILQALNKVTFFTVIFWGSLLYALFLCLILFHLPGLEFTSSEVSVRLGVVAKVFGVGFALGAAVTSVYCLMAKNTLLAKAA